MKYKQLTDKQLNKILSQGEFKTALDIGCGNRELVTQLNQRGIKTKGIDKMYGDNALEPIEGKYDLIVMKLFIYVLGDYKQEYIDRLKENNLNPNGKIAIITPVREKPANDKIDSICIKPLPYKELWSKEVKDPRSDNSFKEICYVVS